MSLAYQLRDRYGWTVWLDEERMATGNIDIMMADGIEGCEVFMHASQRSTVKR